MLMLMFMLMLMLMLVLVLVYVAGNTFFFNELIREFPLPTPHRMLPNEKVSVKRLGEHDRSRPYASPARTFGVPPKQADNTPGKRHPFTNARHGACSPDGDCARRWFTAAAS